MTASSSWSGGNTSTIRAVSGLATIPDARKRGVAKNRGVKVAVSRLLAVI
jgi:hypothetical protein